MKSKLLYFFFLLPLFTISQTPIANYYSLPDSNFAIVTSSTTIDQSVSGANLTWNFNNLTQVGTNIDTYTAPTALELSTYPATTSVLTIAETLTSNESKIYSKNLTGQVSITGASTTDLELNYINDNALIGTFPLNYNYNNSNPVAGTFDYTTYSGTFTGNITATVDAYGTLNMNDLGEGAFSGNVTRLKTVQNLSLTYIIPNVGSIVQTTYYYYDSSNGNLVFRTNTVTVVVSLLGINETINVMESFLPLSTLNINENDLLANEIQIFPNPVEDVLKIHLNNNKPFKAIMITDMSGRVVLRDNNINSSINVSHLQDGLYLITLDTDSEILTKKFIKK